MTSFLESSPSWKYQFGPGWEGKSTLGEGSMGSVGLWEYSGDEASAPAIRQVIVKETSEYVYRLVPNGDWYLEGRLLETLSKVKSKHIVRMYGPPREDVRDDVPVIRLFLEHCPGADLTFLLEKQERKEKLPNNPLLEADIWAIFNCLALAVAVMDRGTEDPNAPAWSKTTEIAHYDIRPENILLGSRDPDHPRVPICKIADFGLTVEELKDQNDVTGGKRRGRGEHRFVPPEEKNRGRPLQHPRKGTCSNIWQVGCVIHCLIFRQQRDFNDYNVKLSQLLKHLRRGGETHGLDLAGSISKVYSKELRELVMDCMEREPLGRPTSLELQTRVAAGLRNALREAEEKGLFKKDLGMMNIPMVGLEWPEDLQLVEQA